MRTQSLTRTKKTLQSVLYGIFYADWKQKEGAVYGHKLLMFHFALIKLISGLIILYLQIVTKTVDHTETSVLQSYLISSNIEFPFDIRTRKSGCLLCHT